MSNMLNVSSSPHLRSSHTTGREMYNVILSLLPATIFAVFHFGLYTLLVILCSIASCMATEFVFNMITHRKNSLTDCSAVVTGILLALVIPLRPSRCTPRSWAASSPSWSPSASSADSDRTL